MNIVKGKVLSPLKLLLYGSEGIGKTTFASHWPKPLFIDLEHGTRRLAVDRIAPESYAEFKAIIEQLASNTEGYQTLVMDTADWLEKLIISDICSAAGKNGIEDFGYGKGYTYLAEKWSRCV